MSDPLVLLGEVRTGLLPASVALPPQEAAELLALLPGQRVLMRERPLALAISPSAAVGVDCQLATVSRSDSRAVGTVASHATLVGGRVAQSSSSVRVVRAADSNRRPWSHYLTQVGTVELIHRLGDDTAAAVDLTEGFLEASSATTLDLGSISERLLTQVRTDARLDRRPRLRTTATRLRWAARVAPRLDGAVRGRTLFAFRLEDESTRSVRIMVPTVRDLAGVQRFCEDVAVHDWLLTTLDAALGDAGRFGPHQDAVELLTPLLEQLVHLWMPGAHTPQRLRELWTRLESDPGFTRQWTAQIGQLRDRLAVATLEALRAAKISTAEW
ncbi:SCO2521 family protein [Nocardia sp. NBC_01503]|uniref:SCO2521 family protein n=1 Tax=Nocardia sp. NBC_01503 TaxID=2975997 RepID=UPI002E7AE34D|nr:SCO2521 family protein [Nocardia sp. NBC_01503]WTL34806.1 SCO2521 family protein [Nocardia sp. NBC_01503]